MANTLDSAIEYYETKLQRLLREVAETKRMVNKLLEDSNRSIRYRDVSQGRAAGEKISEYHGMTIVGAVEQLLRSRQMALSVEEIVRSLEANEFDFNGLKWSETGKARNVAITLAKNGDKFRKLPNKSWELTEPGATQNQVNGIRMEEEANDDTPEPEFGEDDKLGLIE